MSSLTLPQRKPIPENPKSIREVIRILPTERCTLVGQTGSGKSFLARELLIPWPHVIVIDPKQEFILPSSRIINNPSELNSLKVDDPTPIIYAPDPQYDNFETYDGVFKWIYERQNCTVYIDEIYAIMQGNKAPDWYRAILTRGRSRRIRSIQSTQRPYSVPITILSEAQHYIMFPLRFRDDVKRMSELMGEEVEKPLTVRYSFWYKNILDNRPAKQYILRKG